jgi:uncharacterized protein with FMN-binding domain
MKRAALVIAGTVAGTAGVLSFPVQKPQLAAPTASTGPPGTTSTASAGTPATAAGTSPSSTSSTTASATGTDVAFRYGDVAVKVTVQGGKITNVAVASLNETDGRSVMIDSYAVPQLEQQVVAADSANIDGVSGATFTSEAFLNSLSSALSKLGFKG